jgi:hypothetical protein
MANIEVNKPTESRTISFLARLLFFLIHLAIMTEIIAGPVKFRLFVRFVFFLWFVKPYLSTIKNRYYTYWSLSVALAIYLVIKINEQFFVMDRPHMGWLYVFAEAVLFINMFLLSSPIYYPIVSWWEYDFRFRDDLKIHVKLEEVEEEFEGRLTDLRRHAGCVSAFQEYKIGDVVFVKATVDGESATLKGVVMSKRREYFGRAWNYGVQFKFDSKMARKRYERLGNLWIKEKNTKKKLRISYV